MNEKGYSLIEVLISILFISLITIIVLPLIQNGNYNFMHNKEKIEMGFLGEIILEQLKAFDYFNPSEDYILDIELSELMYLLSADGEVVVELPVNEENYNNTIDYPYRVVITKKDIDKKLWKVGVNVGEHSENKRNLLYETYMLKPEVGP